MTPEEQALLVAIGDVLGGDKIKECIKNIRVENQRLIDYYQWVQSVLLKHSGE